MKPWPRRVASSIEGESFVKWVIEIEVLIEELAIPPESPIENINAMMEAAVCYGRYV